MSTEYQFKDGGGITRLDGTLTPDPATLLPSGGVYVTVGSTSPTTFTTPLVLNDTPTTGGLYAWDGTAYQKVAAALS